VKTLAQTIHGQSDTFASTHWSVVLAAGESQADPEIAQTALAQLCQTYWAPLYTFVRSRGYSTHDAQDLTQSFFAFLIERKIYTRVDRQKGKFRSFLLASLKNFLGDSRDRDQAFKRGGGYDFLPLNEDQIEEAESMFQTHFAGSQFNGEDRLFEKSWAEALVAAGLGQLAASYTAAGEDKLFLELKIFLTGSAEPLPSYSELAARLGMVASTLRSDVTRMRAQYREALRTQVRRTVDTDAEVDGELRELLRVLTAS
jgi:DNA-directed RNA polymerase specialized sigma24 family protein